MLNQHITSKITPAPAKVAAPSQGAAAFFCSTKKRLLHREMRKSLILQQRRGNAETVGFDNLLRKTHYFRRNCAKHPIANVVLTEGQTGNPQMAREVAVWAV